jgi:cyclic nucleotide gated channel
MQVLGASWYLLSIERQNTCWRTECRKEHETINLPKCNLDFLDCRSELVPRREQWNKNTTVWATCNASDSSISFQFGIFGGAMQSGIVSSKFMEKYFYCLWWGLRNLRYNA